MSRNWNAARRNAFYDDLLARLSAIPGVRGAAVTSQLPFSGHLQLSAMAVENVTEDPNNLPMFVHRRVTPDVFDALGIPLRRGRLFDAGDAAPDGLPVALVGSIPWGSCGSTRRGHRRSAAGPDPLSGLLAPDDGQRVDPPGAAGGEPARRKRDEGHGDRRDNEGDRVVGLDPVQETGH